MIILMKGWIKATDTMNWGFLLFLTKQIYLVTIKFFGIQFPIEKDVIENT